MITQWSPVQDSLGARIKISDISVEISDIDNNRSEIGHGNSFEGKIAENLKILPIYRYRTEIYVKFHLWKTHACG